MIPTKEQRKRIRKLQLRLLYRQRNLLQEACRFTNHIAIDGFIMFLEVEIKNAINAKRKA